MAAKISHVTFHGLRHTHITHLLRSGVPVHVVSERAGHANPTVTLNIYAHLLPGQQEHAANVFDVTLRLALGFGTTRYHLRAGRIKSCPEIKEDGWPSG